MISTAARSDTWRVKSKRSGYEWTGVLRAYWEAAGDPISDEYTPSEMSAEDLLRRWEKWCQELYPTGLIPIYWFVDCEAEGKFEAFPFQYDDEEEPLFREDFLTFYHWPVSPSTGGPLNWLTLPVVDKLWNKKQAEKGGFIQQATGWKPSILQPYVYLPSLLKTRRKN